MCLCIQSFSRVHLFVTLWTVACQSPLSMGFCRQEYWSGLPFPPPGDLPTQGSNPNFLHLLHWQEDSLPPAPPLYKTVLSTLVTMLYIRSSRTYLQNRNRVTDVENKFMVTGGEVWRDKLEDED